MYKFLKIIIGLLLIGSNQTYTMYSSHGWSEYHPTRPYENPASIQIIQAIIQDRFQIDSWSLHVFLRENRDGINSKICYETLNNIFKESLKKIGSNIHYSSSGYSPLQIALYFSKYDFAYKLLEMGAQVDFGESSDEFGLVFRSRHVSLIQHVCRKLFISPSMRALARHDLELITQLIDKGSSFTTAELTQALEIAVRENRMQEIEFLLNHGAQPSDRTLENSLTTFNFEILKTLIQHCFGITALEIKDKNQLEMVIADRMCDLLEQTIQSAADIQSFNAEHPTLLIKAVTTGYEALVNFVLKYKPNINLIHEGESALTIALRKNFISIAELLIRHGATINDPHVAPLHSAIAQGNIELITFLLSHRADPNLIDTKEQAPLAIAIKTGSLPIVKLLLNAGADLADQQNKKTFLMIACEHNQLEIAKLLLEHGAKIGNEWDGKNLLFYAIEKDNIEFAKLCLQHGISIRNFNKKGITPLHTACEVGSIQMVQFLLEQGAPLDAQLSDGHTPLMTALLCHNAPIATLLIKAGARVDLPLNGSSILTLCVEKSYKNIIQLLLQNQDIRNQINPNDIRLLETAITKKDPEIIEKLIPFFKIQNEDGQRLLRSTILHNDIATTRILLTHGIKFDPKQLRKICAQANPDIFRELLLSGLSLEEILPHNAQPSVIEYIKKVIKPSYDFIEAAKNNEQERCLNLLKYSTIEINLVDGQGNTALHYCVQHANTQLIKELLMHGADPTITNKEGHNPLYYAIPDIARIFITAAMPMKEVNTRTIIKESKKLAAQVNTAMRYHRAITKVKRTYNLIYSLGYSLPIGLLCLTAYKQYPVIKSHQFKTLLKQAWKPLATSFSALITIITSRIYKDKIFQYIMLRPMGTLLSYNGAAIAQALAVQHLIKSEFHRDTAMQTFSSNLRIANSRIKQSILNEFNPRDTESLRSALNRFYDAL